MVLAEGREEEEFSFVASTDMHAGDVFVIETPGGGGYGKPDMQEALATPGATHG